MPPLRQKADSGQAPELSTEHFATSVVLVQLVEQCFAELFDAHGVSITTADHPDPTPEHLCGVAGIGGLRMNATLVLSLPEQILRRTHPGEVFMRDWAGELANQFAGRLKHALWHHGAGIVYVRGPVVLHTCFVAQSPPPEEKRGGQMVPQWFLADGHPVGVWVEGEMDRTLNLEPSDVEPCVNEGGLVVF